MDTLQTHVDPADPTFRAIATACSSSSRELRGAARPRARRGRREIPRAAPRAGQAAGARAHRAGCSIPGSPFLELSPLAAYDMYDGDAPGAGHRHRHRPRVGPRGDDRRQRRDGQGRHVLPDDRQEAPPRAGDRAAEPPAVRLPRRFGRRVPAAAGRGLPRSRALRPHLLQPGAHVGGADSADRRGHGIVHGGRRLRAGDVGRNHHRQGHRHDLPRRSAAREGRDRRGSDGRGARRRRRPHADLRRRRLLRRGRRPRARDLPDDRLDAQHASSSCRPT